MLKIWLPILFLIITTTFLSYPQKNRQSIKGQEIIKQDTIKGQNSPQNNQQEYPEDLLLNPISGNLAPIRFFRIFNEPSTKKGYKNISGIPYKEPALRVPQNWKTKDTENEELLSIKLEETEDFGWLSTDNNNLKANKRIIPLDEPLIHTKPFDDTTGIYFLNNNQQYHGYIGESEHRVYALQHSFSANYSLEKYPKAPDFKVLENRKFLITTDEPYWKAKNLPHSIDRSSKEQILSEGEFYLPGLRLSGNILTFFAFNSSAEVEVDGKSLVYDDHQQDGDILYDKNYNYILKYNYISGIYHLSRKKR